MMKHFGGSYVLLWLMLATASQNGFAHEHDPWLSKVMLDRLEKRDGGDEIPTAFEAKAWVGRDIDKFWLQAEGELVNGAVTEAETMLLYGRALSAYWDARIGVRHDSKPTPEQDWVALGIQGLAPYFFETAVTVFVNEKGNTALRLKTEYELLLTQRWVLSPELELNAYAKDDRDHGRGTGLGDSHLGLRLRYEISRRFAPYIGINRDDHHGDTAEMVKSAGGPVSDTQLVLGIRAWL